MPLPVLAFDIGGANSIAALVRDGRCLERRRVLTRRGAGPSAWLDAAAGVSTAWRGRFRRAIMVEGGHVSTGQLASSQLTAGPSDPGQPGGGQLASALAHRMGFAVSSLPEAQAAAWAEHRFGAAPGGEMVFLSAGWTVGGAVVSGGTLLRGTHGLAGHLGRLRVDGGRATVGEVAGGSALLQRAAQHGVRDVAGLLASASAGARWAVLLLEEAAGALASAIGAIQVVLDPPVIVMGGAIGRAPGFLDRLHGRLAEVTPRPNLIAATLGPEAALVGAADHAASQAGILALPAG